MAFSIRRNIEKQSKEESGLLDASLMQSLQDRFCDANHLYLECLSKKSGVITKAYGSREELRYLYFYEYRKSGGTVRLESCAAL